MTRITWRNCRSIAPAGGSHDSSRQTGSESGTAARGFGDLTELTASIAERRVGAATCEANRITGRWMIIAGERRFRSAQRAGLKEVPCVEMEVDEGTIAEIALIENMQRKDLTVWEEADGLLALTERFGYTHDDVARKVGKSRTTVTEAMAIARIPNEVRAICREGDINAKSSLLQLLWRQPDDETMLSLAKQIASKGLNRNDAREARRQEMGPRVPSRNLTRSNMHRPTKISTSRSSSKRQLFRMRM